MLFGPKLPSIITRVDTTNNQKATNITDQVEVWRKKMDLQYVLLANTASDYCCLPVREASRQVDLIYVLLWEQAMSIQGWGKCLAFHGYTWSSARATPRLSSHTIDICSPTCTVLFVLLLTFSNNLYKTRFNTTFFFVKTIVVRNDCCTENKTLNTLWHETSVQVFSFLRI